MEKVNGQWIWPKAGKAAFDAKKPNENAPLNCIKNQGSVHFCKTQWQANQVGMPIMM